MTGDASLLDKDAIRQFIQDVGLETAKELIGMFIEEAEDRVRRIGGLTGPDSIDEMAREAHSLKSTALTYGVAGLGEDAKILELACKAGPVEPSLVDKVTKSAEEGLRELEAFVANN